MLKAITLATPMLLAGLLVGPPGPAADQGAAWTHFGGPSDDFQSPSVVRPWSGAGPERLWQRPLGEGYSSIAAAGDRLFTMYRDGGDDVVVSLDAATGETRWEQRYPAPTREGHAVHYGSGPHATPLVLEDRVISLGYTGVLLALERDGGRVLWRHDLLDDFGGELTAWGYSASPILYRGQVIVLVGGAQGVIAFDPATGEVRWRSEAGSASYSTPRVIDVHGREELLFFAKDALRSIDPETGATFWSHSAVNVYANHASNLLWDGELLWVASQEETAGRALRLAPAGPPEPVWKNTKVRLHHWNAVLIDGVVYAALGDSSQSLAAVELATGRILWRDRVIGLANAIHTPSGTLFLEESGELVLTRLSRDGVEVLARARVLDGRSWTPPTVVDSRLYVRDQESIRAFDLSGEE